MTLFQKDELKLALGSSCGRVVIQERSDYTGTSRVIVFSFQRMKDETSLCDGEVDEVDV
jgi:hypothetical protein